MIHHADLHIHTVYSDGTDTLTELLTKVRRNRIDFFSITDHDEIRGSEIMLRMLSEDTQEEDPLFVPGVEFSCRDEKGKYHILGYAYDPGSESVQDMVKVFHAIRMHKFAGRLAFLRAEYGIVFDDWEVAMLRSLNNPGKPHIGKLIVKHGYADNVSEAIRNYLNNYHGGERRIRPEEAIEAVLKSGGIPVLAHGVFGDGDQLLDEDEMEERVTRLAGCGLQGIECFYSRYTPQQQALMLKLRDRHGLYATAGSDYHGTNKPVALGNIGVDDPETAVPYLDEFTEAIKKSLNKS